MMMMVEMFEVEQVGIKLKTRAGERLWSRRSGMGEMGACITEDPAQERTARRGYSVGRSGWVLQTEGPANKTKIRRREQLSRGAAGLQVHGAGGAVVQPLGPAAVFLLGLHPAAALQQWAACAHRGQARLENSRPKDSGPPEPGAWALVFRRRIVNTESRAWEAGRGKLLTSQPDPLSCRWRSSCPVPSTGDQGHAGDPASPGTMQEVLDEGKPVLQQDRHPLPNLYPS